LQFFEISVYPTGNITVFDEPAPLKTIDLGLGPSIWRYVSLCLFGLYFWHISPLLVLAFAGRERYCYDILFESVLAQTISVTPFDKAQKRAKRAGMF
jgi:hypothetical protein